MTIDKEKLKALAKLATQGDWERDGYQVCPVANQSASLGSFGKSTDAAYVAALQPSVILALLAEIERHEAWRTAFLAERDAQMRQRDQLKAENEALRKALGEISGQVDGNIRCAVRDVVNCRGDVQDIYGYCDNIDEIIDAAMAKEASNG